MKAPKVYDPALDGGNGDFKGFTLLRDSGANGVGIGASQDTTKNDLDYLILDEGVTTPLLLAQGTYSGDAGSLTADVHPTGSFNVFPDGYAAGGATESATLTPDTLIIVVPEPTALALLVVGGLASATLRRRRQ